MKVIGVGLVDRIWRWGVFVLRVLEWGSEVMVEIEFGDGFGEGLVRVVVRG